MTFLTKGEFIQALKDLNKNEIKVDDLRTLLNKKEYLRFHKVGSPLNYDVVGYDSNGDSIRQLKSHSYISETQKHDLYEALDKEIEQLKTSISEYETKINNTYKVLKNCDKPLSDILYDKYVHGTPYCLIAQHYQDLFFGTNYSVSVKRYIDSELEKMFNI